MSFFAWQQWLLETARSRRSSLVARYRTELEGKSRRDLQSLAKQDYGIPANLKSSAIIDGILHIQYDDSNNDAMDVQYILMCIETKGTVRSLMKRFIEKSSTACGAKCILDCVKNVEAEMSALNAVKPAAHHDHKVPSGKEAIRPSNTVSLCATAVKAVPVIGVESVKPGTKPVGVKSKPAVLESGN